MNANCKGCGKCCINKEKINYWINVKPDERIRIPKYNGENAFVEDLLYYKSGEMFRMKQDENGRCIWLNENNECSIYENRPDVCVRFESGSISCQESIRRNEID